MKKVTAILILLLIFISCAANQQQNPIDTNAANININEETTEINYYRNIPAGTNYDGYTFNILQFDHHEWLLYIEIDEFNGEVLNDAAYTRNLEVCQLLGIEINTIKTSDILNKMKRSNTAGDNSYDLIIPWISENFSAAMIENQVYDWNKIPVVELKAPWYIQSANDMCNVNGKQYYVVSPLTYTNQQHSRMMFNKELFVDLGLEYPYQLVYDGKWTYEALYKYINNSYADLNGDGKKDDSDRFGINAYPVECASLIRLWGGFPINIGPDGFTLNLFNDKLASAADKVAALCASVDYIPEKTGFTKRIFHGGNVLFAMYSSHPMGLRDIEFDFGYLPYPKYDEAQNDYITYGGGGFMAVPISKPENELERVGVIFEALSAASYKHVTDAFVLHYMEGKVIRDEDSVNMYRICRRTETYDRASIFDITGVINGKYYTELVTTDTANLASQYEKYRPQLEQSLKDLYEAIISNN